MLLSEVIRFKKPFSLTCSNGLWSGSLLFTEDPYPWLQYAECHTWLKEYKIIALLFTEGGLSSNEWVIDE